MAAEFDEIRTGTAHVRTTLTLPDGTIKNNHVSSAAADRIVAGKTEHQKHFSYEEGTTDTTATTELQYLSYGAGDVAALDYSIRTAPTSSDTVTIDLLKSADGANSYSSVLTAAVVINSGTTADTRAQGSVSTAAYNQYDRLKMTITVVGTSAAGLIVNAILNEEPA